MTNKDLVRNFLQQEGHKFEETGNAFRFKAQGLNLVCEATDRDPMFIRIVAPVIYSLTDNPALSREEVLSACNYVVEKIKTLKAYVDADGDVMLAVELFVSEDTQNLDMVLARACNVLGQGRFDFATKLRED